MRVAAGAIGPLLRPPDARALFLLAHGAGAGMHHPFMESTARDLAERRIATLRYEFPYMAAGRKLPDGRMKLIESVRAACVAARQEVPDLPLFAGGKSLGGRMTSMTLAEQPVDGVLGLIFLGFPLHRPGEGSDSRADHLGDVKVPMLFVQGTRDRLAQLARIERVCADLGPRATLHVVEGADHGFAVLKRSGRTRTEVQSEVADAVAGWITGCLTAGLEWR